MCIVVWYINKNVYLCNINNNDNAKMRSLSEKTKKY